MKQLLAAAVAVLLSGCAAGTLTPFTTDGCSAFPDGTPQDRGAWVNCCIRHDLAYWKGGTYDERQQADAALEQCVAAAGYRKTGQAMRDGVRVGGSPYWPTPFRWGYGWGYPRGYGALTDDERRQVRQQLENLEVMLQGVAREIRQQRP
jgi:hypothetical protein